MSALAGSGLGSARHSDLATRSITVCDVYDSLTSDRPYRSALLKDEALKIMEEGAGAAFDPACLRALRNVV